MKNFMYGFVFVAMMFGILVQVSEAGTVGHWRFEGSDTVDPTAEGNFLDDSGPSDLDLGISTGTPAPTQYTLPGSGDGSAFSDPIPSTGVSNDNAASWGNVASDTTGGGNFFVLDTPLLTVSDFTIEAYINKELQSSRTQYIASHWRTGSRRSWSFGVAGTSDIGSIGGSANDLFLNLSEEGDTSNLRVSGINIDVGDDYYVAASFDESDTSGGVTFYVQNLTDGGPLQIVTVGHSILTLHDSSTEFRIGSFDSAGNPWTGVIDEVRFSDMVLSETQLLVVPAPAALPAGLAMLALTLTRRRSRG